MPSEPKSPTPSRRVQTPPDLKWLLTERAALAGQARLTSQRVEVLAQRATDLAALLTEAQRELALLADEEKSLAARIESFDTTIGALHAGVPPDAAGCVKAWAGRYGERGALTAFLRDYLREISPRAVLASELKQHVIARFQLVLITPDERKNLKHSIRTVLGRLRDQHGVLETVENWRGRLSQPLWRWKQAPSATDLLRLAALAAEAADERDPQPDAL